MPSKGAKPKPESRAAPAMPEAGAKGARSGTKAAAPPAPEAKGKGRAK